MPNYKRLNLPTIGQIHQHPLKDGEKLVILYGQTPWVIGALALHDDEGVADYIVTTGKTFYAVEMFANKHGATCGFSIYQADTADAKTLRKTLDIYNQTGGTEVDIRCPLNFTIASGKYVTFDVLASNGYRTFCILGYEK